MKGRVDPTTRVRKLHEIDLWEISLVTFPLLTEARLFTVHGKNLPYRISVARVESSSIPPPLAGEGREGAQPHPRLSFARKQAERGWRGLRAPDAAQRAAVRC